uniref:non-specific serine/threonine protein kinase n=1 Tax=Salix viminalis TaxID=40686 RepID=A0A6N2K9N0_SALVM
MTMKLFAAAHFLGVDLWANYLSGNIPPEWAGTKLELLSLGVNRLSGKIPSYLGNITTLRYLSIENNMFFGTVPPELGDLVNLENLTLSANYLSGELPSTLANLIGLKALRLSRNNFIGRIPEFIQSWKQLDALEIEAGGFTGPIPSNISLLTKRYSVHINCGGPATTIGKTTYSADDEAGGAAKYASTRLDWQKSTTGHFWDVNSLSDNYIAQNMSILRMDNSLLYTHASLTPLSLTYYVPCLVNGNYSVKLHFAEIVIRDNKTYHSLGRRVFDVYIQDIVVLKDFDIVTKAGGVDKGVLSDGTQIAVKQLSAKSKQGNREFVNEIGMISALQHPNLVRLYGCCIEGKQLLLVYEYMENNSLAHVLFGTNEIEGTKLDWRTRQRICVNIAKGLVFLHEESTLKIVHRDIKGTNILLDKDMNAKISDFGMAKLDDEENTHIDTRADVYSFGVVALEIVSGMNNAKFRRGENFVCLLDWVLYLQKNGDIMEMVDPRLGSAFNKKEVVRMINVALLCTNQSSALRPIMSTVVSMLEGKTDVEELVMVPSTSSDQSGYAMASFNKFAQASFSGMEALLEVATQLGKKGWNRNMLTMKCNDTVLPLEPDADNEVICNCSNPGGVCHVVAIYLKRQDLDGSLPKAIQKLPHLKQLSLWANYLSGNIPPEWADTKLEILSLGVNRLNGTIPSYLGNITTLRYLNIENNMFSGTVPPELGHLVNLESLYLWANYLSGNIPPEWADTKLELLSLGVNRLSGKIPSYLGKITTLRYLSIENNMFNGTVPPELGDLVNLESLILSANNLSGELPLALANLIRLKELRLSSNNFTGRIPEFIQSWKQLDALEIQAGGFTGPIPSSISLLTITVLPQKPDADNKVICNCSFPGDFWANYLSGNIPLEWADTKLEILSIGVNRLSGKIPSYLGKITTLKALNIENNMFSGTVPPELGDLVKLERLSLSANYLSGELPLALANLTGLKTLRLNSNNFTGRIPEFIQSWKQLDALEIEAERYSVHINCGGLATTIEKTTYEADDDLGGAAKYAFTGHDWQKSTTGHFWDVNSSLNNYIAQNMSILRMKKSVLYTNARLTPLSLTYYVPCLANGNYNVKLHFAEIVMRDNRSYYSLGRRVFDVYIQNIVVLKDFDIVTKAGGVDKGVLSDGTRIAVKQLSAKSKQGNREFVNEIGMISALQHPNLVRLYGCCIEGKQLLLVYEYMENNSLAHVLFGTKEIEAMKLDWSTRQRICVNIAKGLVFLHEESTLKIVHRDIKGTNILLDKDMNAKISDFGMAKLDDEDNSHIDTRADVYSFGVVALEIVSGMNNVKFRSDENFVCLLDWVLYLQKNGDIMEMVDPRLESAFNKKEVVRMINVALLCTNQSPALRPAMSTVVSMLEGKTDVEELVMVSSRLSDQSGYELVNPLFNKFAQASLNGSSSETKSLVKSFEGTSNKLGEGGFSCVYKYSFLCLKIFSLQGVLSDGTQIAVKQLSAKS